MDSKTKRRNLLKRLARPLALVIVLVIVFSPFQQILVTPIAQAKPVCNAGDDLRYQTGTNLAYCMPAGANTIFSSYEPTDDGTGNGEVACNSIGSCLAYVVYIFTAGLGSGVAYVGAWFFNIAVYASLQSIAYALDFISQGWTQVRDLANMAFIFILIYIAFTIMLKAEFAGMMQMLAKVIVVALLINFSFFLTRVVIDAGNLLAVQFYNVAIENAPTIGGSATGAGAVVPGALRTGQAVTNTLGLTNNGNIYDTPDLTAGIMGAINVQGILNNKSFENFQGGSNWATEAITLSFIYLAVGIILFILAAIFLSVGIRFIIRIVILWLAIIASPLALIMHAIPKQEKWYYLWQNTLISQAFYPAIFLFLFLIVTGFAYAITGCHPGQACDGITGSIFGSIDKMDDNTGGFAVIAAIIANVGIKLGFIVVLLIMALQVSDKISKMGGDFAGGFISKVSSAPGRWSKRAGGFAFQQTAGRGAAGLNKRLTQGEYLGRFGNSALGYRLRGGVGKIADLKVGGARSFTQFTKERQTELGERRGNLDLIQKREDVKQMAKTEARIVTLENKAKKSSLSPDETAEKDKLSIERDRFAKKLEKYSDTQLAGSKTADLQEVAKHLTESQVAAIQKIEKFSKQDREAIEKKWHMESAKAPLKIAEKQVQELAKIEAKLGAVGVKLSQIDTHIKPLNHSGSAVLNLKIASDMKKELEAERDIQEDARDDRTKNNTERTIAGQKAKPINEALRALEKATEELKKMPPNVSGRANPSEVEVTKK